MPDSSAVLQRVLLAAEGTPGAGGGVSGWRELGSLSLTPAPEPTVDIFKPGGQLFPTLAAPNNETSKFSGQGVGTYTEVIYPYASLIRNVTPTTPGGASTARRWTFSPSQATEDTPQTFALLRGTAQRNEELPYCLFTQMQHEFTRGKGLQISGIQGLARRTRDNLAEWLTISGTPSGGTFTLVATLTDSSALRTVTAPIAHNANAATIQAALEALATIGTGGVVVTGTGPFTLTFSGTETAARPQALIATFENALTGGTTPAATVTRTTAGAQPSTNEVQSLTISGTPTGGTYRLQLVSCPSATIAYNAAASAVQTALLGMPCFTTGDVTVSGSALPGNSQRIAFAGRYLTAPAPALSATSALTGGTSPAISLSPLPPTVTTLDLVPILGTQFDWYAARTEPDTNLAANKLTRIFNVKWSLGNRWGVFAGMDTTVDGFSGHTTAEPSAEASFLVGADDQGMQFLASLRSGETVFLRGFARGPVIETISGTPFYYEYEVTMAIKIEKVSERKAEQALVAVEYSGKLAQDNTWGRAIQVEVQNAIAAL